MGIERLHKIVFNCKTNKKKKPGRPHGKKLMDDIKKAMRDRGLQNRGLLTGRNGTSYCRFFRR